MRAYGVPADEVQRLRVLESLAACDLVSIPELDRITRLAARHFRVPMAMVNLVDAELQWSKSVQGGERRTLPREHSFCSHTILHDQPFVINDARADTRFVGNPLVAMPQGLVFYAGYPIRSLAGYPLGALCLIDHEPREFGEADAQDLQDFAALVEQYFRGVEADRRASLSVTQFERTFSQASVGMALVSPEWRWLRVNGQLAQLLGRSADSLVGERLESALFAPDKGRVMRHLHDLLAHDPQAPEAGLPPQELLFLRPDGSLVWFLVGVSRLAADQEAEAAFVLVATDITARKASEQALAVLQLELEHRVESRTQELSEANARLSTEVAQRQAAQVALEHEKELFRATLAHATDAFIEVDPAGRVTAWNEAATDTFGWRRDEAVGRSVFDLVVAQGAAQRYRAAFERLRDEGLDRTTGARLEVQTQHRDGRLFPSELSLGVNRFQGQVRLHAFLHDISARKAVERELLESRTRLRLLADNMPALIAYVDGNRVYQFNNQAYEDWFGVPVAQIVGRSVDGFMDDALLADRAEPLQRVQAGEMVSFDSRLNTLRGEIRVHTNFIPDTAMSRPPYGFYILAQDVTEQYQLQQRLQHEASHDALTGLPNRRAFLQRLVEALARVRRQGTGLALMFLDLDGFKQYNDTYGHDFGDAVLRHFARTVQSAVRETDSVARLAGDEFTIILEGLAHPAEHATLVARKLIAELTTPVVLGGRELTLAASIGVAVTGGDSGGLALSAELLLSRADAAMYQAKAAGKAQFALS